MFPALTLILGSVAGYYLGALLGFPPLDVITGFLSLIVVSFFSFRRLKRLDSCHSIEIVNVLLDPWGLGALSSEGGAMHDQYVPKC